MLILISTAESPSDAVVERGGIEPGRIVGGKKKNQLAADANMQHTNRQTGCAVSSHQIEADR